MKRGIVLLTLPILLIAKTVSFNQALVEAEENNLELKAKSYDVELARESIKEPGAYKKGTITFNETLSRTNHAGYVFGMKMASREASFGDFGFSDFLGGIAGAMQMAKNMPGSDKFSNFINIMSNPQAQKQMLSTKPDDLNNPGPRTNFETKFVYEVPLFTGYKLENAKTMAKLQLKAKIAKFSHNKKKLGLEVLKAYNGAVTAKKFIQMTKDATKIAKHFQDMAQDLYDSGLTRYIDVEQAKMAAYSISTKTKEAKTQYKLALAYLRFLTSDDSIKGVKGMKSFKFSTLKLNKLQELALSKRDDLEWMKKNVQTMKTKIAFDSSDEYPTIGVHTEYGLNDNSFSINAQQDYYLVAVGLKKKLFDGELTKIKKQKAKIEYLKTLEYKKMMKDGIKLEVEKNLKEFLTNVKVVKEKRETEKMAKNILKEMENIYKNNLKFRTNMTYLLFSFGNMLQAQADRIKSEYDKSLSGGKLKLSIGQSLGE
jgi:outer membrane protein TolC